MTATLLVVHHSPTASVRSLTEAVLAGTRDEAIGGVEVVVVSPGFGDGAFPVWALAQAGTPPRPGPRPGPRTSRRRVALVGIRTGGLHVAERSGRLQDGKHGLEELRRKGYM